MVASIGDVANASIVSGDVPGQAISSVSCGKDASGRYSTGMFRHANTPSSATEP